MTAGVCVGGGAKFESEAWRQDQRPKDRGGGAKHALVPEAARSQGPKLLAARKGMPSNLATGSGCQTRCRCCLWPAGRYKERARMLPNALPQEPFFPSSSPRLSCQLASSCSHLRHRQGDPHSLLFPWFVSREDWEWAGGRTPCTVGGGGAQL